MLVLLEKFKHGGHRTYQVAAAVVGSAVVGGAMNAKAAKSASNAQESAAAEANATQRYMYDQTREDNAPFRATGIAANNRLAYLTGIGDPRGTPLELNDWARQAGYNMPQNGAGWTEKEIERLTPYYQAYRQQFFADADKNVAAGSPDYGSLTRNFSQQDLDNDVIYQNTHQYAQDQGNLGVNRLAAASGSQLSGATLKALQRSGANIANQYGNESFNRSNVEKTNTYNRLAGLSGAGQQATNQVASAGQNMANQVSNNQTALGNARGASAIAQGNAWSNALSSGVNAYQQQNYLNSLNSSGGYSNEMARLNAQAGMGG